MKTPKINFNRPQLSSDEIAEQKDFNSLHDAHTAVNKPFYKSYWFIGTCIIAALTGIFFSLNQLNMTENPVSPQAKEETLIKVDQSDLALSPFVSPIKDINIPFSRYEIDGNKDAQIEHSSGTRIFIPKGSLQLANGKIAKGPITIQYREFHDQLDILLSGIPMNYDSAGALNTFESAGMIEFRAFQGQDVLQFVPGKYADIEMPSNNNESRFNQYMLDDKNSNWTYIGKDEIITEKTWNRQKDEGLNKISDKIKVKETELQEHEQTRPFEPLKRNINSYSFDIEVDHTDFPYLANFDNVEFEVLEGQDFNKSVYSKTWNNAQLSELVPQKIYEIKLTGPSESVSYKVRPILSGSDLDQAMTNYESQLESWNEDKIALTTEIEELKSAYKTRINTIIKEESDANEAKKLEEQRQKSLSSISSEFLDANTQAVKRKFKIRFVGICNIDFPIPLEVGIEEKELKPKGKKKLAYFMNRVSQAILAPAVVYIIEKGKNLIYKFNRKELTEFRINKSEENTIWFLTKDGRVAVCRSYETDQIEETEEEYHFIVEVSTEAPKSKESLEAFLLGKS